MIPESSRPDADQCFSVLYLLTKEYSWSPLAAGGLVQEFRIDGVQESIVGRNPLRYEFWSGRSERLNKSVPESGPTIDRKRPIPLFQGTLPR
jgi:hypothetical protein